MIDWLKWKNDVQTQRGDISERGWQRKIIIMIISKIVFMIMNMIQIIITMIMMILEIITMIMNILKVIIVVTQLIFRLERQHLETWLEAEKGGNHCLKRRQRARRRGGHQYQRNTPISTLQIITSLPYKLILSREIPIQYFISKWSKARNGSTPEILTVATSKRSWPRVAILDQEQPLLDIYLRHTLKAASHKSFAHLRCLLSLWQCHSDTPSKYQRLPPCLKTLKVLPSIFLPQPYLNLFTWYRLRQE